MTKQLELEVLETHRGFYIGTFDPEEGPQSRASAEYWLTRALAKQALESGKWTPNPDA